MIKKSVICVGRQEVAVGLTWPGVQTGGGNMPGDAQTAIRPLLNSVADHVVSGLARLGLPPHSSPLFRPWNLFVVRDPEKILCGFSPANGLADVHWTDEQRIFTSAEFAAALHDQLNWTPDPILCLPFPESPDLDRQLQIVALEHVIEVERTSRLGRLGDLEGLRHLEPYLREFLNDHPDPERNVFIMMRFLASDQLDEAYATIRDTLSARGFSAVRADDRDYTGELWSNIEVYLTGSKYGIAILEDIERRDFNPNVSLELGYMLGRRKRCLILKEQRLPDLPADVVHRLYKTFDMFNVRSSVAREIGRWIDVDLGVGA